MRTGSEARTACLPAIEEGLQNQRGGNLIHDLAMLLAGVAGLIKNLVGLAGGEAFIPKMNGKAGQLAEFGGKGLRLESLWAWFAAEV